MSNFPKDAEYNFKYGACLLFEDENKQKSLKHLEFATRDANVDPLAFYYLGRAYHMNFRFNDAIEKYKEFESKAKKKLLKDFPVDRQIEMCENGKSLVRTFSQLYVLDRKEVNPKDFYRSYDLGDFGGKIIVKPDDFKTPYDIKQNESSIMFLGNNSKEIYFSSFGEKGENGKDIFKVIKLNTGGFSDPIRVEELSTPYDDDYPYLHPNGKVIYFSSQGFNSMGGYDVFKSEWNEATKTWSKPKNLEFPTNSPSDDILFITDANDSIAYFASPRAGSSAKIQVYKIRVMKQLEEEYLLVDGAFIPGENATNKRAKITVKNKATGELIGVFEANAVTGKYAMNIPKTGTFELIIESEGNPTQKAEVTVPKDKDIAMLKQEMKMEKGADGKNRLLVENTFEKEIENLDFALDLIVEKSQLNVNITEEEIKEKEIAVVKREIPAEKDRSFIERAADTKLRGEETPEMIKARAIEQIENILADVRTIKNNQENNELKAKNIAKEALAKTNDFKEANNDFNQIANALDKNTAQENEIRALLDKKKELEELSKLSENLVKVSAALKKDNEDKKKLVNEIEQLVNQWNDNLLDKNIEQKVVEKKQKLQDLENKSIEDYISDLQQTVGLKKSKLEQEKSTHKEIKDDIARLKREISDKKIALDKTKKKTDKEDIEQVIASLEDDLKISKKQLLKREFELSDANIEFVELDNIKKQIVATYESSAPQLVESKKSELSNVDIAAVENSVKKVKTDFQKVEQLASPVISSATSRNISTITSNQIGITKELETHVGFQELTAEKYSQSASYTSISEMAETQETKTTQALPEKKKAQEPKKEEEVIESAQVVTKTQDVPLQPIKTDRSLGESEESTTASFDKSTPVEAFTTSKLQSEVLSQSPTYFSDDTKVVYENNKSSFDEINELSSQINQLVESAKSTSSASEREKIQSDIVSKKQNLATVQNQVYTETSKALENEYQKNQNNVQSLMASISDENDDNLLMAQFNSEEIGFAKQNIDNLLEKAENTSDPIEKSKILEKANLEKQKLLLKQFETKVMLAKSAPETSVNALGLSKDEIANYEREIAQAKNNLIAAENEVAQIQSERESLIADSQSSRTQTPTTPREETRTPRTEQTTSYSIAPSGEKAVIPVSREISEELLTLSGESQLKVNDNSFINDDAEFSKIKSISENPNYDQNWNLNDYINNSESAMIKVVKLENDAEKYKSLSSNLLNIARNTDDSEEKAALMQQSNELERRALVLENEALQLKQFSEKVSQKAFEMKLSQDSGDDLTMEVSEDGSTVTQYTDRVSPTTQQPQQESNRVESSSPSTTDSPQKEGVESQEAKSAQKDESTAESQERELTQIRQEEQQISITTPSSSQFPVVELTPEYEEIKQEIIATEEFQNWSNIKSTLDGKKEELRTLENSLAELEERSQQKLKKKEQKSIAAEIEELEQKRTPLKRTVENIEENLATLSQIYYQDYGFNFRDINSISEVQLDEYLETGKVFTPVAVTAIRETQATPTQSELAKESSATQKSIPTTEEQTETETPTEDVASNQEQRILEESRTEEVTNTETPPTIERQQTTTIPQESRQTIPTLEEGSQTAQTLTSQEKSEVKSSADYARLLELYREAQEKRRKAKEQYDRAKQLERQAADAVKESENIMSNIESLATDEEKVAAIQRATQLEEQSQTLYQQAQEALALAQSIENEAISAESQEKAISQSIPTASLNKIKMVVQEEEGIIFPELADVAAQSPQQTTRTTETPRTETPVVERREQRTETQQRTGTVDTSLPSFIANNLSGEPISNLLPGEAFSINPTRNVYSDNNAIPIDAPLPEGVLYTVQVGAFRNPIPQDLFREFTPLTGQTTATGITRYRAGFFKTFRNADAAKIAIRGFGYADAFVVALNNGEPISVARAREIEQSSGVTEAPLSFEQGATGTPPPLINETGEEVASFTEINNIQGLMFTVQIGVFSRPVVANQMQNAEPLYVERRPNGYLRYTSGLFNNREEAIRYRETMVQRGYSDAFVTAFNNGQRITVAEAQNLVNQNVRMVAPTDLPAPTEVPRSTARQTTTGLSIDVRRGDANNERGMRSGVYRFNRATGQIVGVGEGGTANQAYQEGLESMTRVADEESNAQRATAEVRKVRGLIFRVQIGAFREEIPTEMAELFLTISNLGVQFANREDGYSVYTVGNFDTIDEARSLKDALSQKEGFEGVFVVAYYDNEQISIERAIEILSE